MARLIVVAGCIVATALRTFATLDQWTTEYGGKSDPYTRVRYGNGLFVVLQAGQVLTSHDGKAWSVQVLQGFAPKDMAFGDGLFVAVGDRVMTSADGHQWTAGPAISLERVAFGNGLFIGISGTDILTWAKGDPGWEYRKRGNLESIPYNVVGYGDGKFVCVGSISIRLGVARTIVTTSPDGIVWTDHPEHSFPAGTLREIEYGNGKFVASGYYHGWRGTWATTSPDGITWTGPRGRIDGGIAFGAGTFVAVSWFYGDVFSSTDGENWILRTNLQAQYVYDVGYGNGTFIVAGAKVARATVFQLPQFTAGGLVRNGAGSMRLRIAGEPQMPIMLETSSNLLQWTPLVTLTNHTGVVEHQDANPGTTAPRFYRAKVSEP